MSRRMQINPTTQGSKLCTYARMRQSLFQGFAACARMKWEEREGGGELVVRAAADTDTQPTECSPRVRHCYGATAQWDRHCSRACIIAFDVSDATRRTAYCAILSFSSLQGIMFSYASRTRLCSHARESSSWTTWLSITSYFCETEGILYLLVWFFFTLLATR